VVAVKSKLESKNQTVAEIARLVKLYANDLSKFRLRGVPLGELSLRDFFDFVRAIPYRMDKSPVEVVARPEHIIKHGPSIGVDCKKKCVLMLAWARLNGVPARIVTSSKRADRRHHHIFPQVHMNGQWVNVDATYSHYRIAEPKKLTSWALYGC